MATSAKRTVRVTMGISYDGNKYGTHFDRAIDKFTT